MEFLKEPDILLVASWVVGFSLNLMAISRKSTFPMVMMPIAPPSIKPRACKPPNNYQY